jgi:ketosteroid isomerase-like protein
MSQEPTTPDPVELVRGQFESANRGDFDAALSFYAPDAVWDLSHRGLGTFEGVPAIRCFAEDWFGAYEEFEIKPEEILDLGNGVVLAVVNQDARPAGGAGHVRQREGWVYLWARGMVVRTTTYGDVDEARGAAKRAAES